MLLIREFSAHVIQEGNSNKSIIGACILNRPTTIALCDVVRFGYIASQHHLFSCIQVAMENMAVEKEYIFKQAGVIDPLRTMDKVRQRTIRTVEKSGKKLSYTDYWKLVPPDLIDRVRFYYRYEIFLFDYPETPFTI